MVYKVKAPVHTCLSDRHVQTVFVHRASPADLLVHKAEQGRSKAAAAREGEDIKGGWRREGKCLFFLAPNFKFKY